MEAQDSPPARRVVPAVSTEAEIHRVVRGKCSHYPCALLFTAVGSVVPRTVGLGDLSPAVGGHFPPDFASRA